MTRREYKKYLKRKFGDGNYQLVPDITGKTNYKYWLKFDDAPDLAYCWVGGYCAYTNEAQ